MRTTVLLVDDNEILRGLVATFLEIEGFRVESAPTGKAALEMLEEVAPDVVVTDIHMPHMNGVALATEIQKRRPDGIPPVVAVTANLEIVERLRDEELFYSVLPKPADLSTLNSTVREAVDGTNPRTRRESSGSQLPGPRTHAHC